MTLIIRPATLDDIPSITKIYGNSVLYETASWELTPPDEAEMARRMQTLLDQHYPYFVATVDGTLAGYSYASSYRPRPGYRFTVEDSVYMDNAYKRRGIARQLVSAVIDACTARNYRQMIAVIGDSANLASIALHQRLGFTHAGLLPTIGFKHGRWLDGVIMQRPLGTGSQTLPE